MSYRAIEVHEYCCDLCGAEHVSRDPNEFYKKGSIFHDKYHVCSGCAYAIYSKYKKFFDGLKNDKAA